MNVTTVMVVAVAGLAIILVPQAGARSVVVDRVSSALQESFNSLNSKRNEWFENYSTMNNLTKATNIQLKELAVVSKMALPLMWALYKMTVKTQKEYYPKVVEVGEQSLPFHAEATPQHTVGFNFYLEATFLLQNYRERAVMGYDHDRHETEKVVLDGDRFPGIQLYQPFRVNVQVNSDCIVASIWLTNLDLIMPAPLPEKHIWCTRDYSFGQNISFDIDILNEEDENHQHHDSQDEHEQVSQEEQEQASQEDEQASQEENSHEGKLVKYS